MTETPTLEHIFISYSRRDRDLVQWLAIHLEAKGIRVWYDDRIHTGDSIAQSIQESIDKSFAVLVVVSPASITSTWVRNELSYSTGKSKRVYPIVVEGAELPVEIAGLKYAELTASLEPPPELVAELQALALVHLRPDGGPADTVRALPLLRPMTSDRFPLLKSRQVRTVLVTLLGGLVGLASGVADFTGVLLGWPALLAFAGLSAGLAGLSFIGLSVRDRTSAPTDRPAPPLPQELPTLRKVDATPRSPEPQSQFAGRANELAEWRDIHRRARAERSNQTGAYALGPVVLAIHGAPGVGKSAFAQALARDLAADYPDGYFLASFGVGGTARAPADILRDLLAQLGWPKEDMPAETEDRVATLRSLTRGRRMLFLFDAARDHDQVRQVIPAEPGCAVIISSRRAIATSLGLAPREPLGPTSMADSLELLHSVSGTDWTSDAETAVELVELCGRLPLALHSAALQIREGYDLRQVVENLRPEQTRLAALEFGGRSVEDRIRSEYDRLFPDQRQALVILARLDAETFVPWVLRSLMDLKHGESSGIAASLASAQLIEAVGEDGTGKQRYRLNPLVRVFAAAQLASVGLSEVDIAEGQARLDEAYLELADDVLAVPVGDENDYQRVRSDNARWRSTRSTIAGAIRKFLDQIVRREFANVVRIINRAPIETHRELIWRTALLLDAGVPAHLDHGEVVQAFTRGTEAANHRDGLRAIDVRLAYAQFLVSVERYDDADVVLSKILEDLRTAHDEHRYPAGDVFARRLRAARIRAGAFLSTGSYEAAARPLSEAERDIGLVDPPTAGRPATQDDLRLLRIHHQAARRPLRPSEHWPVTSDDGSGYVRFRGALSDADVLRRQRHWLDAASQLRLAAAERDGDARALASVQYRLARLAIQEAQDLGTNEAQRDHRRALGRQAVEQAALCARTFSTIGDDVGRVRALCMLVRALVVAGQPMAATRVRWEITALFNRHQFDASAIEPLRARFARARGELALATGAYRVAWNSLNEAAEIFAALHDWAGNGEVWRILERLQRDNPVALSEIQG